MAYPGENRNKEYMDYAIAEQTEGREPLSLEEWMKARMQQGAAIEGPQTMASAIDDGLGYPQA